MTPLREAMIRAMQMRGLSQRTHHSYLTAVTDLARCTKRSPADLTSAEVNDYFEHLVIERGLAPASCRLFFHGIRFLYVQMLHWPEADLSIGWTTRYDRGPAYVGPDPTRHVHLHCLVPGVELSEQGQGNPATSTDLFPVRALSRHIRGGFVSRLRQSINDGRLAERLHADQAFRLPGQPIRHLVTPLPPSSPFSRGILRPFPVDNRSRTKYNPLSIRWTAPALTIRGVEV